MNKHKKISKQFCPKGHDTLIVGRQKGGRCKQCHKERYVPVKIDTRIKQFCPYGHNTFICGRQQANGKCKSCIKEEHPLSTGHPKTQFCPKGHDKDVVGRTKNGSCLICSKRPPAIIDKRKIKERFCCNGHDTFLPNGRNKWGRCVVCQRQTGRQQYAKHKEKRRAKQREYDEIHAKEIAAYRKTYREENKEHIAEGNLNRVRRKMKEDVLFQLQQRLRDRLRKAIKNNYKSGSAVRDLGCSIEYFKQYVESMFYSEMIWSNWGSYWEMDHIEALWKFDLTDRKQLLKAVNYTNMQPLTIPDHKKKTVKDKKELAIFRQKHKEWEA